MTDHQYHQHAAADHHDNDDDDDDDECRVCRGPAEEGRPLFQPCRCSGSIGLTHQDCLQSWLRVAQHRGAVCELCHTNFRFAPQYAHDTPDRLTFSQLVTTLLWRRAVTRWIPWTCRVGLAAALWLGLAPLLTAYLYHGWMARPRVIVERMVSWPLIQIDLVSGAVVATCIVVSFLSLMSLADFLRVEWQQRGFQPRVNHNNNNNNNNIRAARNEDRRIHHHNNNNNDDADDNDEPVNMDWRIDNGIWDYAQQQVLEQNREQNMNINNNNNRNVLTARQQRAAQEHGWDGVPRNGNENRASAAAALQQPRVGDEFGDDYDDDDDSDESWMEPADENDDEDDDDSFLNDEDDESVVNDAVDLAAGARHRGADWRGHMMGEEVVHHHPEREQEDLFPEPPHMGRDNDDNNNNHNDEERNREPAGVFNDEMERLMDEMNEPDNDDNAVNNFDPPPPAMPFDMEQDDVVDMDINIALDELLGFRGPLLVVVRNLLWLLAFNAVYLGFFAFVPRAVGMAVSSVFFNTTMFASPPTLSEANATLEAFHSNSTVDHVSLVHIWKAIEAESALQNTAFRLHDVAIVLLGYFSLALSVIFCRFMWLAGLKVRNFRSARGRTGAGNNMNIHVIEHDRMGHGLGPAADAGAHVNDEPNGLAIGVALGYALDGLVAIVKVGLLLFLKMFLLPIVLGIALDASTFAVLGNILEARIAYAGKDLFSFLLMHWVAGITFMLLVTVSVLQLREVAHPDLLARVIRPQEPQPDLLGNLMHESIGTHAKRMVLSLVIYVCLLAVHIYFPVRYCIATFWGDKLRSLLQLKFAYIMTPQLQVPLELLVFHLFLLAMLERYKNGLGGMQHHWLRFISHCLGITDRLLPMKVCWFRFVGTLPVYESRLKVDPFWFDMANKKNNREKILLDHVRSFEPAPLGIRPNWIGFETRPTGERVLPNGPDFIRLPIRLPGRALRNKAGLIPTKLGKYRLRRDTSSSSNTIDDVPRIELWEEVVGEPIVRPPEGWDDLGAGGADVQGRWAWGDEKKSTIEGGVAVRRPFFSKDQTWKEASVILLKLVTLGLSSWLVTTILLSLFIFTPLVVGRTAFYLFRIPDRWIHDPFGFGLGFMIMFPLLRKLGSAFVANDTPLVLRFFRWIRGASIPPSQKAAVLINSGLVWFFLVPWLVGFMYELAFVKSNEWFYGTEPHTGGHGWLLKWSLGTLIMYVWADLCIWGIFTRNYRVLVLEGRDIPDENAAAGGDDAGNGELRLTWQGKHGRVARFYDTWKAVITGWEWDQVNEVTLMRDCATPVLTTVFVTLAVPLLPLAAISLRYPLIPGSTRAIVTRSLLALTCCFQLGVVWKTQLRGWFEAAHRAARNDRYLIGEVLLNYGE